MSSGGVHYFFEGFSLIKTKGLKRFVFVPLTINLVLFSVAFYYFQINVPFQPELQTYLNIKLLSQPINAPRRDNFRNLEHFPNRS